MLFRSNRGESEAFARITHALREHAPDEKPVVKLLEMVCACNSGQSEKVVKEVSETPADGLDLITLSAFAGLMLNAGRDSEALRFVEVIKKRVSTHSSSRERLIVADILIRADQFSDAVGLLESVDPSGRSLPIQTRRLRALLFGGYRRKSKDLLEKVPPEWLSDDAFRRQIGRAHV